MTTSEHALIYVLMEEVQRLREIIDNLNDAISDSNEHYVTFSFTTSVYTCTQCTRKEFYVESESCTSVLCDKCCGEFICSKCAAGIMRKKDKWLCAKCETK